MPFRYTRRGKDEEIGEGGTRMWAEAGLWDNNRYTAGTRRRNRYLRKKTDTKKQQQRREGGERD
ncbi:hypothetical protein K0M31_009858 [Melipona bicolor]|uniref:Uncharacterized protein n=1 Tax=Melipona bicolor TaxID=60889 RepID=A0AA40KIV5_9HYME|nr:hypothetical protein K0M31_009858 [Melipona bicolor]